MKKIIFSSMVMLLTLSLFAQPNQKQDGPPKPPPIAERWKRDSIKLQLYVNISPEQVANVKNAFVSFYNSMDAMAPKEPGNPPGKEDMDKIIKTRKDALKTILNEKQFARFETFEKEFMPPHHPPVHDDKKMPPPQL
jgi:hypothetical protein